MILIIEYRLYLLLSPCDDIHLKGTPTPHKMGKPKLHVDRGGLRPKKLSKNAVFSVTISLLDSQVLVVKDWPTTPQ